MTLESLTPNLMVENVNESAEFYQEHLGFEIAMSVPEQGTLNWAMLKRDTATIMLQSRESLREDMPFVADKPLGFSGIYFVQMNGLQELHERVKDKVEMVMTMRKTFYGTEEFAIKDNSGYILVFAQDA